MKKIVVLFLLSFITHKTQAQFYSLSSNVADWAVTNVNVELGIGVSKSVSIHLPVVWNPWTFGAENKKMKQLSFLPQARYWFPETYLRWFVGSNLLVSRYNWSPGNSRYDGMGYGLGISAGYSWILSTHWNLEAQLGIGGGYFKYKKYDCGFCGDFYGSESKWLVFPNRVALSFVYLF